MRFDLDLAVTPPDVVLEEPDNFRTFDVVVRDNGGDPDRIVDALAGVGRLDGDHHVWVDREQVARLAGARAGDPAWRASFDALVEYARGHGWVDDDGALRAHIVWPE